MTLATEEYIYSHHHVRMVTDMATQSLLEAYLGTERETDSHAQLPTSFAKVSSPPKVNPLKGKTYEEVYGIEKAKELKDIRRKRMRELWEDPNHIFNDPDFRERQAEHCRKLGKWPIRRAILSVQKKEEWKDPNSKYNSQEFRELVGNNAKKAWADPNSKLNSEQRRRQMSQARKEWWASFDDRSFEAVYGVEKAKEIKHKKSKSMKLLWENDNSVYLTDEYRERQKAALDLKPNKPETLLIKSFEEYSLPIWYCGNYSFWIDRKNPDFKVHGQRKVIEFAGEYWHTEEEMEDRVKSFKDNGFDCLVIWGSELSNLDGVIERVKNYVLKNLEVKA